MQIEPALRQTIENYESLFNAIDDFLFILDERGMIIHANSTVTGRLGYTLQELAGKSVLLVHPETRRAEAGRIVGEMLAGTAAMSPVPLLSKSGAQIPVETRITRGSWNGKPALFGVSKDISHYHTLLAEKELLLKEVNHRIKNNMNTMVGILALHGRTLTDPAAAAALADAGSRMQSMRLLYDKLYRSSDCCELALGDYLSALIDEILANFPQTVPVTVEKRFGDFKLDARRLQPLGIIVNELLTNIMKYAFSDKPDGRIIVSAVRDAGDILVTVEDNGRGIPESVSMEQPSGFGLTMVHALAVQLGGTIRIERAPGTRIVLRF